MSVSEINQKEFLSARELALLLDVSEQFIYGETFKARSLGEGIPHYQAGPRLIRFNRVEVMDWFKSRRAHYRPVGDALEASRAAKNN